MNHEELPPHWAISLAEDDYTITGAQLCTRDGRKAGNAVNIGIHEQSEDTTIYKVLTDIGNVMYLNEEEMHEMYYPPVWVMHPHHFPSVKPIYVQL